MKNRDTLFWMITTAWLGLHPNHIMLLSENKRFFSTMYEWKCPLRGKPWISNDKKLQTRKSGAFICGRNGEIWTRDLFHPKEARYQAAPRPVNAFILHVLEFFVNDFFSFLVAKERIFRVNGQAYSYPQVWRYMSTSTVLTSLSFTKPPMRMTLIASSEHVASIVI